MTQAICDITTDEVNVDVVVEPQADTMVEVANRAGGMEQVFHDNTLIGNGNSIDLGVNTDLIATKEYVDEKVESIDTYTKDQIDGKLTAVDAQIDANADAIQKTREDYINADSEIHQILNSHTSELTTLRGNQASLGDQVSGIEEKIPESASGTNPLITKQQLLDEEMDIRDDLNEMASELQTQITAQAAEIATKQDQLTAGDNITIVDNVISATGGGGGTDLPDQTGNAGKALITNGSEPIWGNLFAGSITLYKTFGDDSGRFVTANFNGSAFHFQYTYKDILYVNPAGANLIIDSIRPYSDVAASTADAIKIPYVPGGGTFACVADLPDAKPGTVGQVYTKTEYGGEWQDASGGGSDIANVVHDTTLAGSGTDASPLGLAETIKDEIASKAPTATVDALTAIVNDILTTYLKKTGDTMTGALNVPEFTVSTAEGTLSISVVAGVPVIASNNGMDIASRVKFDYAPTTDDSTTYADALDTSLVRKAQVATAISSMANDILGTVATDYITLGTAEEKFVARNQGAGNAGKVLMVDSSGSVIANDVPASGTTITIKRYN